MACFGAQSAQSSVHDSCTFILCPMLGALDCILPAFAHRGYFVWVSVRLISSVILSQRPDLLGAFPEANRETCEICGAQSCGFCHGRTHDGNSEKIGLKLHEHVIDCGAAINAQ